MNGEKILGRIPFIHSLQEDAGQHGLAHALSEGFSDANVELVLKGDTSLWSNEDIPVLMVGDHRGGLEQVPLMAIFGVLGRNDLFTIAVPHSNARRILKFIDKTGSEHELPVLPRLLANDRPLSLDRYTLTRMIYGRSFLNTEDTIEMNESTFNEASILLQEGHAINIFPAGHVKRDIREKWPRGIGEIVSRLDDQTRKSLIVVPYRFEDDFSANALIKAFAEKSLGMYPRKRTITIEFSTQLSAWDLVKDESDPLRITDILHDYYMESVNPPRRRS